MFSMAQIERKTINRLCKQHTIVSINGQLPGPTLYVYSGDTVVVTAINRAQYNATLHWYAKASTKLFENSAFIFENSIFYM